MPDAGFVQAAWSKEDNSEVSVSNLTGSAQINVKPGSRWLVSVSFEKLYKNSKELGRVRAWLSDLEGLSGLFFMTDPTWCDRLGVIGKSESSVVLGGLPEITGNDSPLYPAEDLLPSDDLYPSDGNYDSYSFNLSFGFDAIADLVVSSSSTNGVKSLSVNSIVINKTPVVNDNPWDYSNGVRPGYEEALASAMARLSQKIDFNPSSLLCAGDWVQIGMELKMVTKDFNAGDSTLFFSPPMRYPVDAGTVIEYESPGVVMHLADNKQPNFSADKGSYRAVSFSAVEFIDNE
jgi:hypothetical protein